MYYCQRTSCHFPVTTLSEPYVHVSRLPLGPNSEVAHTHVFHCHKSCTADSRTRLLRSVSVAPAQTSKLLSTRAYKVGNIADGNDPGLTQNVKLIREDKSLELGQRTWDPYACLRGNNIGGHVRSARSSTTAKRKA